MLKFVTCIGDVSERIEDRGGTENVEPDRER